MIETLELQYFWKYRPTIQTFRDYQKLLDKSHRVLLPSKDNIQIPRSKYKIKTNIIFFMNERLIRIILYHSYCIIFGDYGHVPDYFFNVIKVSHGLFQRPMFTYLQQNRYPVHYSSKWIKWKSWQSHAYCFDSFNILILAMKA